jgi:pSer/pThr/pTyr-binding forkhead associated (FHA) protein
VTADRAYYETVRAATDPADGLAEFPDGTLLRRFPLSGTEVQVGRRSVRHATVPDIDLSAPPGPVDPGVSRLHLTLVKAPDGNWSVVDRDSANGTLVNGTEIPPGKPVPLRDGDQINLGAWTSLTITRD